MLTAKERLIVALDVPTLDHARGIVGELAEHVGAFKVGLQLLTAEGAPAVLRMLSSAGARVMYDGKFDDIGNTMAGATRSLAAHGAASMFTVHASAGPTAMAAAAKEKASMAMLAVTVLTSLGETECRHVFGTAPAVAVTRFVVDALRNGADGIVCSPSELATVRAVDADGALMKVVPGIRPDWAAKGDQARIATPFAAIKAGATHLVVGRPITQPSSGIRTLRDAAKRILDEVDAAMQ